MPPALQPTTCVAAPAFLPAFRCRVRFHPPTTCCASPNHPACAGAGLSLLPCLTDGDLRAMGVAALGARKKLLLAAEELLEAVEAAAAAAAGSAVADSGSEAPDQRQQQQQQQGGGAGLPAAGLPPAAAEAQAAAQQRAAAAYRELLQERRASHAQAGASGASGGGASGLGNWRALAAGGGGPAVVSCDILQYFKPVGGGTAKPKAGGAPPNPGSILAYLRNPDGSTPAAPVPAPAAKGAAPRGGGGGKPAAQQWAHKAVAGGGGKRTWGPRRAMLGRGGGWWVWWCGRAAWSTIVHEPAAHAHATAPPVRRGGQVLPMRPWQVVPGTGFVVDRFCNLPPQARPTRLLGLCGVLVLPSSALPSLPFVLLCALVTSAHTRHFASTHPMPRSPRTATGSSPTSTPTTTRASPASE